MDAFDFALQMELDGEMYYRNQAAKVKYDDLKIVLEGLAEDEQRHYKIIQSVQNQTVKYINSNYPFNKIPNVFNKTKENAADREDFIKKLKDEQLDIYRAALLKEKESVELYKEMKEASQKQEEKFIFDQLIKEEGKHVEVIGTIVEMLQHVNDWVEAAEFNHQDTY